MENIFLLDGTSQESPQGRHVRGEVQVGTHPSGARESRKAPRRRPPLPRRWRITTTTCPIPSTTCPSAARCVLDGNISDESMGHLPRLHGLCATLPWPCATDPWATGGWLHGPCATAPWATCDGSMGHRRLASCRARAPRHCRLSTPPSSRDGGVERLLLRSLGGGGRANGRVSTPPTPSATTAASARVRRLHLRL